MKKRRLVALAVAVIVVALMLEAGILKYVNDKTTYRTSEVLLGRVLSVLEKNDESETDMIESLKADYIVRARAVAYILDAKPEALDARLQDFDVDVAHWKGELVDTMSIAWGYVLSTEQAWESVHEISKAADKRMYERKAYFYRESGMNRRKS